LTRDTDTEIYNDKQRTTMLATTAAVRKVIQGDGHRRFLYSRRNGLLLSLKETNVLPLANERLVAVLRASYSHSAGTKTTRSSVGSRKDDLSDTTLSFSDRLSASSVTPSIGNSEYFFNSSHHKHRREFLFPLEFMTFRSSNLPMNRGNTSYHWESKMRFNPQYESRVFLSSSSSSSSESSDKQKKESTRQNAPGYTTQAKIPIPKSSPTLSTSSNPFASIDFKAILKSSLDMTHYFTKSLFKIVVRLPGNVFFFATHKKERREKIAGLKEWIKKEVDHYWVGIKVSLKLGSICACRLTRELDVVCEDWKIDTFLRIIIRKSVSLNVK
jgi:hypothetical protein